MFIGLLVCFQLSTFFGLFYECCSNVFEREMHGSSRYRNVCRSFKHSFIELPSWPPHFFVLNEYIYFDGSISLWWVFFPEFKWMIWGGGFLFVFIFLFFFSHFFCKEKDLTPAKLVLLVPYYHHKVVPSFFNIWYSRYSSITGFNFQKVFLSTCIS